MFALLLLALSFLLALLCLFPRRRTKNGIELPPGPMGIPILGNAHQMAHKGVLKLSKWAEQYGKIYTIYIGSDKPTLVVNEVKLMKQIFGTMASAGRLRNELFDIIFEGDYGIFNTDGKTWQEQRNFLLKTLKDFGFGNKVSSHLESMMLTEIQTLSQRMEADMQDKGTVFLNKYMNQSAGGTIWALVTGKRITPQMAQQVENIIHAAQKVTNSGLLFFSWLKYVAPKWSGYADAKESSQKVTAMVKECFAEHEREGNTDGNTDIISAYLKHFEIMQENPKSVFFGAAGAFHNVKTILTLLVGGVETTATTLNWLLFYLCVHPDVQKKFQEEIDEALENRRDPTVSDRGRMMYTEAIILETLRLSSAVPFGIMHQLTQDITIQGQTFPEGLALIANTYHVHHDTDIWGDPDNFRPERFLEEVEDDNGKKVTQINGNLRDSVVIFQPGRRTCVGESLARDILFMFAVKLCQTFNLLPEDGRTKEEYMDCQFGLFILPPNVGIRVERRN